ncbi:MAG: hypothetical protein R3E45_10160 [Rhodocyclaceae bacterium]
MVSITGPSLGAMTITGDGAVALTGLGVRPSSTTPPAPAALPPISAIW